MPLLENIILLFYWTPRGQIGFYFENTSKVDKYPASHRDTF